MMKILDVVAVGNCFVLHFTQTPSPKTVKTGPKTPLFPAADMPDLLTFLTPATPGHEDACTATKKYTRYSVHVYRMVRLHVILLHFVAVFKLNTHPGAFRLCKSPQVFCWP